MRTTLQLEFKVIANISSTELFEALHLLVDLNKELFPIIEGGNDKLFAHYKVLYFGKDQHHLGSSDDFVLSIFKVLTTDTLKKSDNTKKAVRLLSKYFSGVKLKGDQEEYHSMEIILLSINRAFRHEVLIAEGGQDPDDEGGNGKDGEDGNGNTGDENKRKKKRKKAAPPVLVENRRALLNAINFRNAYINVSIDDREIRINLNGLRLNHLLIHDEIDILPDNNGNYRYECNEEMSRRLLEKVFELINWETRLPKNNQGRIEFPDNPG